MSSLLSWILKRFLRVPEECLCQPHHDICLRRSHFLPHFFYPLSLDVTAIKAPTNAWMYFWFDYTRQLLQNRLNRYFQNPDIAQIGPTTTTTTTHPPTGRLIAIFWVEISLFGKCSKFAPSRSAFKWRSEITVQEVHKLLLQQLGLLFPNLRLLAAKTQWSLFSWLNVCMFGNPANV